MTKKDETKKTKNEVKKLKTEIDNLRQQLECLQKEKNEIFDKLQRVSADYLNYQKRASKQITDTIAYEKEMIIKSLLPALDNFEHTLQNAHTAEQLDVLIKGIQIVYDQILDILKSHGVEQIEALGQQFDPSIHQAMMQKVTSDKEKNTVLEEFQKGYKLNSRVIRPSKVVVNKPPAQEPLEQERQGEKEPCNNIHEKQKEPPTETDTE